MSRKFVLAVLLLAASSCVAFAQGDMKIEFEGLYWVTDLSGSARVTEHGFGTDVDFVGDLGIEEGNFPEGRFTWYTGPKSKLRFAYIPMSYSATDYVERTIEFGGETYTIGTDVATDIDVEYLRLGWERQFVGSDDGKMKLAGLLEAKGFWSDMSLTTVSLIPVEVSRKFEAVLPTIGVALDLIPNRVVGFFAEVSGVTAGEYGHFLDGEAGVKIIPVENFSIVAGYRILDVEAKDDPDYATFKISGPFVGVTIRF